MVTGNLTHGGASLSWGNLAAKARCKGDRLDVQITVGGKPLVDGATYKLATSDFLASGGDGVIGRLKLPEGAIKLTDVIIRDGIADTLRKRKGTGRSRAAALAEGAPHGLRGTRPLACGARPAAVEPAP